MNKFLSIIFAAVIATTFYSCGDDDSSNNGTPTVPPTTTTGMSAKINGATWTAFDGGVTALLDSTGELLIFASGAAGNDTSLVTLFTEAPQGGPYTLDTLDSNNNGASVDLFFGAISGVITFTAHDANANKVSGTFNFVTAEFFGAPAITVTEGVFSSIVYVE